MLLYRCPMHLMQYVVQGGTLSHSCILSTHASSQTHTFAIITDKDHNSIGPEAGHWHSVMRHGSVQLDPISGNYSVSWGRDVLLSTRTATKGRSMELSELVQYRHLLLAFCDSTGMVWKVNPNSGTVLQRYAIAGKCSLRFWPEVQHVPVTAHARHTTTYRWRWRAAKALQE